MKVAVFCEVVPETRAGNYIHFRLGVELARRGHEITMLCPQYRWVGYSYVSEMKKVMQFSTPDKWSTAWENSDVIIYMSMPSTWVGDFNQFISKLNELPKRELIYFALDYWDGWLCCLTNLARPPDDLEKNEKKLIENASKVIAVSPQLCEYLSVRYGKRVYWIPNAAAIKEFTPLPCKRENYAVIVSSLIEVRTPHEILNLALRYKYWQFFWFGAVFNPQHKFLWEKTRIPPNVHFCGEVGNTELGWVLSKAKVAIVMAGANPFSYFADPTKWYLYHAARLPIVSINTPHHKRFPDIYPNTFCGVDLDETFGRAVQYGQISDSVLEFHDWSHRAYAVEKLIEEEKAIYGYAENGKFHLTLDVGGAHDEPSEKGSSGRTRSSANSL